MDDAHFFASNAWVFILKVLVFYCFLLTCGTRFPLSMKETVYNSYIRPAFLYGCEVWCVKGKQDENLVIDKEIYGEGSMWSSAQR